MDLASESFCDVDEEIFVPPRPAVEEEDGRGRKETEERDDVETRLLFGWWEGGAEKKLGVEVDVA